MFTTVARYPDPIEAHIACGRLRAEGIGAHVADDQLGIANWEWRLAVGGTRVCVPERDASQAQTVLRALDAGEYALDDALEAGAPAAGLAAPDRESWSSRLAWAALMLLGIPLPWRRSSSDGVVRGV